MTKLMDARFILVPHGDEYWDRLSTFEVSPELFRWIIGRKITISGLPSDAEYVRSWHDPGRDLFCMVFRSREFPQCPRGVSPFPGRLMIFEELREVCE